MIPASPGKRKRLDQMSMQYPPTARCFNTMHDAATSTSEDNNTMKPLPIGFSPGPMHVICGRGKAAHNHEGNVKFRREIDQNLEEYSKAATKVEKSQIVSFIVEKFTQQEGSQGGFVKKEGDYWYDVGQHLAREKVGQCLRDLLHSQYRSSAKAKQERRKKEQIKFNDQVDKLLAQADCNDISERIKAQLANSSQRSDSEIQSMFNKANCELLQVFKDNEERARRKKKRKMTPDPVSSLSPSSSLASVDSLDLEPIPLNETLEKIYFGSGFSLGTDTSE